MGISVSSTVNSANTKYHMSLSSGGGPDWSIIPSSGKGVAFLLARMRVFVMARCGMKVSAEDMLMEENEIR